MSHVATLPFRVTSLTALQAAAKRLGLEFRKDQKSYRWYGYSVGDYPLPEGFAKEDLGKCDHALSIPGKPQAYEVGVVAARDGKPGYVLHWDFWRGGYGLQAVIGEGGTKLKQAYAVEAAKESARRNGFTVSERMVAGKIQLVLRK